MVEPLNTKWYVSGLGAGSVGSVLFSDVEHLIGADDNEDEFIFSGTGGLAGSVEGGARGYDTVVLGGGTFDSVVFTAVNGHDGAIARDADVLTYTGFEPITDNSDTTDRVIVASAFADEIKVSRTAAGMIKVESDNFISTFESIEFNDPSVSLTIKSSDGNTVTQGDTVTIESLGALAFDLIIETGSLSRMEDDEDSITFTGDLDLQGKKLQATAETITVNSGVTLKTSNPGGTAGSITFNSWNTTISTNAKLLAEGDTAGDITINAIDENAIFTPILNIDIKDVGITVQTGAEIKGDDVKLVAKADNRVIINTADSSILEPSTWGSMAADFGLSLLDSLLGVVTVGKSTATVDIQTGTTIDAKGDFEARASSFVAAVATPVTPFLAIGIAITDTTVTIGGQVTTGGDATIVANAEHTVNVVSDSGAFGGVAGAAALSIIDSDTTAQVTDDANLTIGGDLFMQASTIDRNRTMARSTSGKDGDIAVSIAVTVEGGTTEALLDGHVTAANVDVIASMAKEVVEIKQLFIVPSLGNGTAAIAGTGTDSKGDLLDDTKAQAISDAKGGISKFATWAKEKFTGPASEKQQKDETVTKGNARSFDVAAAIAVVVDSNETLARIGDGNADADGKNGLVAATGAVNVLSSVKSRPDITAASSAATNPTQLNAAAAETKFGGSLAVAVGVYTNNAYAYISEQAKVNSDDTITVDAKALNEIDPLGLWGVNLITPFLTTANYNSLQGSKTVEVGETVEVMSSHTAGGDSGTWYKFMGDHAETVALGTEDYSDETRWESLGNPVKHILLDKWLPTAATYLNDNLGLDGNLVDTWSQAVAEGQKTALAGAVTVLDFDQTAEAVIKSGALINQPDSGDPVTNGDQNVVIGASSTAHFVNFSGNIKLPGITGTKNSYKPSVSGAGLGSTSGEGGDAVGATLMVFDIDNTTIARIEDGATLAADSLQLTADTFVVNAALGASGGESDDFGLNGAFIVSMVENTTLAHIENGAIIAVGSAAVADAGGSGASIFLDAQDKTYAVTVTGGVATSEHIGVGLSAGVNILTRNTEAVIGNRYDASAMDTRGTFTSLGDVRLNAENEGFAGTIVVAGSKASQKSGDDTATSGSTGMQGKTSTTNDDPGKWPNNQSNYDNVIAELKQKQMGGSAPAGDESVGKQQGKGGIAVSGAAAVTVIEDNARAYIHEAGVLTASGKAIKLTAANDTHVGALAGGIAFAGKSDSASTDVAVAGAFGGNFVSGTTAAYLDDVTSVSSKTLTIEADRDGWVVSLTAGVSGASGRKGIAIGGSIGVTLTDYTTEALLANTTGTIDGALTVDATDDTNIVLVAGSAGFGGKAGIGAAVAFAEIGNTTRATIDTVTDLKVTGPLSVLATSGGLIIAVTGSAGVGSGENSKLGLAGTVTVNRVANTTEAKIVNSTFHADSTGNITIKATDDSFIFSFAGAFGASKSVGIGVAAAVNLLDNTVRATVADSTLRTTGTLDVNAEATGTLVSVALGVGSGKQFALAGSITVNIVDNTIEAEIINGSDVKVGGAIDISADDRSVGVAVSGGAAFGKTAAVGAAFAGNFAHNTLKARVDDSLVESTGSSASVGAEARATLVSVAIGGAGGDTFALGGAVSVNQVENTIEAFVTDMNGAGTGKATLLKAQNDISVAAADDTTMVIVAGGLAFAKTAAIGVSASTAQVQNKVHAYVNAAEVHSTNGKISVSAGFRPPDTDADLSSISLGTNGIEMPEAAGSQIVNIAIGVAGGTTFAGGGAFSLNWIRNDVKAYAAGGANIHGAGDISFAAFDDPEIDSFAVGGGIGTGTFGAGLGLSYNYIGGDPGNPSREIPSNPGSANVGKAIANINASTVTSTAGSVSVLAGTTPKIINATIAGSGGGTVALGGSFSINFIRSIVDASVTGNSSITANNNITVSASAVPVMISIAGNINVGGTAGIGVASSTNDMQSKITALIDGSKAKATTGDIIVDATIGKPASLPTHALVNADEGGVPIDAQIWSVAVAGSGAGNAAVAGSLSLNWIRNDVSAKISNITNGDPSGDEISAGGKISVTASDASTINAIAGAISVAISSGSGAAGAAVAYNYLGGDPNSPGTTDNNKVTAAIENVSGQLKAASIDVKAAYTGSVNNITLGAAGAQNFALGGSVSINKIRNTADAHISGSTGISTTSGNITIEAKDTSTIRALAGGVGVSIAAGGGFAGAFGIGAADNTIENTTKAYIDGSTVTSAAGLSLTADAKQKIQTLTIGGAVSGAVGDGLAISGAGSGSGNTVNNQVLAYITNSGGAHEIKANNGSIVLTAKDESTIQAASGAVAVAVGAGGGGSAAAAVGISVAVNDITNNVKAYIDASKVTATNGDIDLKATENATIEAFAMGGSVGVAATGGGGGAFAGAGAGTGNTIGNTVQAYVSGSSTVSTMTSGAVKLTASDTSTIYADSGGVALTVAAAGGGGVAASFGASASVNTITNTVQAYVDSSTITSAGAVEITATSSPTIDAFSLGGAVAVGAAGGGAGAFAGAGSGAGNTVANTVQAFIKGTSTVTSQGGAVKLAASDSSKIHVDSGGVAVAVAAAGGGTAAASVGASVAVNKITNTVQAYVDSSTVTSAGAVELSATSTPTIEAVSVAGAVTVAAGGGGGLAGAGSGASSTNTIANTVEAYAKSATITSQNSGKVSLTATETGKITAHTFGGSVSVAAGAAAGAIAISVSLADNDVHSAVRAYSQESKITSAGALDLLASSSETADSMSIAVSVAVAGAPVGGAFSGGGANSFSRVHNTVEAYAQGTAGSKSQIQAAGLVTISASESSTLSADVGVGSVSVGLAAGSIGVSIASNKADSTVSAYVDHANLTSTGNGVSISATANDTISKTLGVATSIAAGIGASAAGAEATATVTPTLKAYIGSGALVNAGLDVGITAKSISSLSAETVGASGGLVSVGASVATATSGGTISAYVDGTIVSSRNVTVSSDGTQTANATATAVSGGIISGAGADATATVNPTVKAYGAGNITASDSISFAATATPQALASALGISVGVGSVGVSDATALSSPTIEANPGGASTTYVAKSFSVSAALNVPVGSYTASSHSTGATGGLIGVNATSTDATTSGTVYSSIADNSTLIVSDAVSITATGDSKQRSEADSFNIGLIAVGGNVSVAKSTVDTRAFLGKEVTISNGTDIGGLTDGGRYYVVLDDRRTFTAAGVDTSNGGGTFNSIDLGADHGLKTGDRVVYKAGATGITGLTSLDTYSVELVGGTNRIRLRSINDAGVVGGIVDLQSAQAGTFQLTDARRVRLATSSDKALKNTPDIDIDATTTTGAKHQLTPVTGFAAGALEFNPGTQANSSKDTLELPSGHGLLTGAAVTYGRSGGAVLTISAAGTDYVHAISESGSGGVVAGAVATANTIVNATTKAFIADDIDGDKTTTLLRVSKLNISATHTSQYDSELSSIQASLLGYSGGWANNDIKSTVEATVGAGADVVTQDLMVTATSKTRKDIVSGPNVKSGSGGVFQGNNAESLSNLENRTSATVGNNASVRVTGSVLAPGNFLLSAYNEHLGDDEVLLDTGGAIVGSGVKSQIKVNVNDATAAIGDFAVIETVGAIDMQTRARGELSTHPQAHTYGLAGGAGVDSLVHINNDNLVSIGTDTTVQALGDVNMLAGKDRDGARNFFKIRSHGDDLNATAVPISTLKSHVQLEQDNDVVIGERTVVKTARDANLIGETLSTADIVSFGTGKNWLTAIAGGIDSLLGSDGASEEEKGGTTEHPQSQTVTVNGIVEVGILKDQTLVINKGAGTSEAELTTIATNVGGMKVTTTIESLSTNLVTERQRILQLISEYQGDLESIAAYTAMLQQIEQQMEDLGLVVETTDGLGNVVKSVQEGFNVPYITVDPIWAQSGTIRISGGSVLGTGELKAPGNVNVTIVNNSPAYLRLKGITIPDNEGGRVRLNGVDVTEIASFDGTITSAKDGASPTIIVASTFDEADPANFNHSTFKLFRTPDLEIAGEINALQADLTLISAGSVLARSNILAGKLTINAGKDFVLTSTSALFNSGGSPASALGPWSAVQAAAEAAGAAAGVNQSGSVKIGGAGSGIAGTLSAAVNTALGKGPESNIVAANNVVIVAQTININGVLQAGIADHKAVIDSGFASKITAAETARTQFLNGQVFAASITAGFAGITADESYTYFKLTGPTLVVDEGGLEYSTSTSSTNNLPVYYNAQSDRLEVSPVRVQGGFMSLTGRILNTNQNAEIRVMDGYGRITVQNDLNIPLQINRLDAGSGKTSEGIEGKLIITDSGEKNGAGAPLVTEYTRLGSDIQKKQYFFVTPGTTPTILDTDTFANTRQTSYTPESTGYRFYWTTGQDSTKKTYTTYGTSAWLNIDAFAPDPSDITDGPYVEYATPRPLAKGDYLAVGPASAPDYTYEFERIPQDEPQTRVDRRWETSTWYGETTYYTKTLTWQGLKDVHTHSIRADRPVSINFIGYSEGAVTVTTKGDLSINGEIQNSQGTTSLTATLGTITQDNDSVTVGGRSISLTAGGSIGGEAPIRTNLTNGGGGSLSAIAAQVVRIEEITGDLTVNQVKVNTTGDRVELKANSGSILGVSGNLVQGGLVTLESTGSIGSLGAGGSARTPGAGAQAIIVDTGNTNRDTFTAKARGDVFVREKAGDLRLVTVDTRDPNSGIAIGNVRLEVAGGRMTDANTFEVRDLRTEDVLMGIWENMNATESTAYVSIEQTVRAFEEGRTREYQAYWNYRHSQDDTTTEADESKTYDPTFEVTLSAAEVEAFSAYYVSQGFTQVEIDDAIQTLENGRTQEYHDLHKTYGRFGDAFELDYRYGTAVTQAFGDTAVDVGTESITLKGNVFDTGDGVVYHSGGGSITGLVDGTTYYVVSDGAGQFRLASTREDALDGTATVLLSGAVTGASHLFSAADNTFTAAKVDDTSDTIELSRHTFTTGTAVVFQSSGAGTIDGLTDGQTYYVVADPATGKIQLSKSHADATNGTPLVIDLGAVSGSGFLFSEADTLAHKAAWSESQLKNSFSSKILGPKGAAGTTATKEDANVIGNDVVLDVNTHVGSFEATVEIQLPLAQALDDTQKLALAAAERSDVTFYADLAGTEEILNPRTSTIAVQLIRIVPKADVDVTVKGALTIVSGATVNVGSEETLSIDQVTSAQSTRVKGQKALTDAKISDINVITGHLILEAEEQGIGVDSELVLNLHAGSTLVARAHDDINLRESAGDMRLIEITSTDGHVNLVADGSILDADVDDEGSMDWNIKARSLTIEAGWGTGTGSIGTGTDYLEIEVDAGGTLNAIGDAGVHLHEVSGNMLVNLVESTGGDVRLRAANSIIDFKADGATDVFGRSITLTADVDSIGGPAADLEIDSSIGGVNGSVTTKSAKNVHLVENVGDLRLNTVTVTTGTAFIKAINGSILNAHENETTPNVLSGNVWLFASQDIGASGLRLTTESGKLEGQSTSGSTFILNTGALIVGGITGSESGISSGGEVSLTSESPITVAKHISGVDNVEIIASDDGADGDFVLVKTGYTVTSTAGSILIQAGDEITFEQGVQITAHQDVTVTGADDSGNADDVLVGTGVTITATTGAIAIQAGDGFTIEHGAQLAAAGNVVVTTTDDALSGANGDFLLVKNGATITSAGSIELRAGDDLTIEKGAFVDADTSIILRADYSSADVNGAAITIEGALQAPGMQLHGGEQADTIVLRPESLVGDTQVFGHGGDDKITLDHLPSITTTQVIAGQIVRDTVDLDGGDGADSYVINITGKNTDYLVNINDTGATGDDVVTINATADDDLFLVRENFVAYLNSVNPLAAGVQPGQLHSQLERINYSSNVENLNINSLGGDDHFYVDDNSAKMTLDGGIGKDFFQFGQLFGTKREAPAVAVGDEISALRTTLGWLSRGVSYETTAMGGDGEDTFQVYSNQAELGLEGNDGDDTFIVRSFALADENGNALIDQSMSKLASAMGGTGNDVVQYNVNANLAIDGGGGDDRFILLGSELSDDFVITATSVFGGGHSITYQNVEKVTVDGLQGNDNFFILGTKAGVLTTVAGGHGWDTFHVGGDITRPIASLAFAGLNLAGDHFAAGAIGGPLVIEGGFGPDDFSLRQAVILPTETDELLSQLVNPADDDESIDALNIFNDGSSANDVATLTDVNFRIEGMAGDLTLGSGVTIAGGITYQHVETLEIMLGSGDDALTIEATMDDAVDGDRGPLTIVHGGGGSDNITVNGGGGADSPLVIFGDTEQDGARYAGMEGEPFPLSGQAWQFLNAGDDTIDASNADGPVAIFGGRGNDTIFGSEYGDQLAGGSGDDTIHSLGGDDIVYGDSGFNIAEAAVTIPEPNNAGGTASRIVYVRDLDVVYAPGMAAPAWADTLVAGGDVVNGGEGDDIVIGDLGLVTQTVAEDLYNTGGVVLVETRRSSWGGDDTIVAAAGDDIVLGGTGADTIDAGDGDNIIIGDNGIVEIPGGALFRVSTTSFFHGGDDTITALGGQDFVLGGNAADTIDAGEGDNLVFGDDGRITYATDGRLDCITSTSTNANGGVDDITTGAGQDLVFGGRFGDTIDAGAGNNVVFGDSGRLIADPASTSEHWNGHPLPAGTIKSIEHGDGGNDIIITLGGQDTVVGGNADDTIDAGEGDNLVFGDDGQIVYATDGRLSTIVSMSTAVNGGADHITTGADEDIVLGGRSGDTIHAGAGDNVVFGDSGQLLANALSTTEHWAGHPLPAGTIEATEHGDGGDDTITTLGGQDIVIGGHAGDTIDGGDGDNVVFGDDGELVYATDGRLTHIASTSTDAHGGVDGITTGAGHDIVLGGRAGDTINAGAGDNVVFGDSGQLEATSLRPVTHSAAHLLPMGTFESTQHDDGGVDTITTLGDYDIILGGHDNDTIDAGNGDNLVFGDDGQIVYAADGRLALITSTSTDVHGGTDNITTGAGQDIVLGGRYGDTIQAGAGDNMVFGDSGQLVANPLSFVYPWASHPMPIGTLDTIEPGDGGIDTITTLDGSDLVLGGVGGDVIGTGAGDDVVIGDHATVDYVNGVAVRITTTETSIGGDDTIHAGDDDDVVIGGTGADAIDGGSGRDLLLGDSADLDRSSTLGNFRNPRFRALTGTEIYSTVSETAGFLLIDADTYYADPRGPAEWADYQVTLLHHETVVAANLYGDDYIAGGADDDMIFGQLGNDVVQGDGSIDVAFTGGVRVGASRDAAGLLVLSPSFEGAFDGHDYIEGGGGTDVLFGNNGQDDIIGGSSRLFSRLTPEQRPDAADFIFGGAGTHSGRNDAGDATAQGHANDADTIVGDNGNIFRLVAPAGVDGGSTFRTFNYDNYSTTRIVPHGVTLLDYTAGGPSYVGQTGPMVAGDIGGADEIHGEAGDDTIYGGALSDVIFGDAQDDDLVGGYGHDWISGGTGDDGILGDDGRIFTSRNGTAEPLNGVATAVAQTTLVGNGAGSINATVNVTGTLQKHVDLTPFNLDPDHAAPDMLYDPEFADDIIFGGLGRDFIHAGAGDDAVSGAEALGDAYIASGSSLVRSDFNRPFNPGDALNYDETTTLLAQYDPNNPMRRILLNANGTLSTNNTGAEFFLNFNKDEGPLVPSTTVYTDGDDIVFGDQGNDWLVGGTGRDHIFAGWGDDLINADDDHTTNGGLNNQPDAQLSYGDIALGGAGRDVLIANTAADVLIDSTEFDTFMIPFAKYGPPTVNRAVNPQLEQFLYSLGAADGADQTRVTPGATGTASGSVDRRGEPFGELALVTHADGAAHDQHGGPRDPQSGNEGGTSADSGTTAGTKVKGNSTGTTSTGTTSALTSETTPTTSTSSTAPTTALTSTAPTTSTSTPTTSATPSIDWTGTTANVTVLPWAQTTPTNPVGLSMPTFDVDDDDDDLIDWTVTPTATSSVTVAPTTTTTLSATDTKKK